MTKTPEELTEEWKAGKLDVGFYYVKGVDGLFGIMSDYALYRVNLNHSDNEITLLAPVPTYDEYKAMQAELAEHRHYCCCSENEVMQLKLAEMEELLRECLAHLSLGEIGTSVTPINILLTRINAVLGCNETQASPVDSIKIQESEE